MSMAETATAIALHVEEKMSEPTVPPAPPKIKEPTHATYIFDRRPQWKYHNNIGQAKNACSFMRRESYLYEIVGGELKELYHITPSGSGWKWGPEEMPWNNTDEVKQKAKEEKHRELRHRIKWHLSQIDALRGELEEVDETED